MAPYPGQQPTTDEATPPHSGHQSPIHQDKTPTLKTPELKVIPGSCVPKAPIEDRMNQLMEDMALSTAVQGNQDLQNTHGLYASQFQLFQLKRVFESDFQLLTRRVNELEQQARGLLTNTPSFEYQNATENAIELVDNQSTDVSSCGHDTEQTIASEKTNYTIRPEESVSVTDLVVSRGHKQSHSTNSNSTHTLSVTAAASSDTSAETTLRRFEHSATNDSKAWKPAFISKLPPLSDKILDRIPPPHKMESFSKSLLMQAFGDPARQYAPGIYWISRKVSSILPDRLFYILDEKIDPFLPGQPGEHGAKLTAFVSSGDDDDDGPKLESYMNAPVFILKPGSNDDEQYIFYGMYSQTRLSDKLDYDRMQEIVPDHVKLWWAKQLGRRDRAPNVTEDLKNHFWPKGKYDGPMPPNLTEPMSSEAQKAAEDYIRQHAHWDMEDNLRVSHIETKEILEAFDRPDCSAEPGLRLYWKYLECVYWDRGFYDMLLNMKRSKGDLPEDIEPARRSTGQSAQRGNSEETAPYDPRSATKISRPKRVQTRRQGAEKKKDLIAGASNIGAPRAGGVAKSGPVIHRELESKPVESDGYHGSNEANTGRKAKCVEAPRKTDAASQVSIKSHEKLPNIIPPHLRVRGPHTALAAKKVSGTTDGGQDTPPQRFAQLVPLQSSGPPLPNAESVSDAGLAWHVAATTEKSSMTGNPANWESSNVTNTSTSDEDGGVLIGLCYTPPEGGEFSPQAGAGARLVSEQNQFEEDYSSPTTPRAGNIMISYVPPAPTISRAQSVDKKVEESEAPSSDLPMRTGKSSTSSSTLSTSSAKKRRLSFSRAGAHKPTALDLTIQGSTCGGKFVRVNPSMCSVSTAAGKERNSRPSPRKVLTAKKQEKQKEENKQEETSTKKSEEVNKQTAEEDVENQPHLTIVPSKGEPKLFNPEIAVQMAYGTQGKTRSEVAKMRKKAMHFAPYLTPASEVSAFPCPSQGNTSGIFSRCLLTVGLAVQGTSSAGVKRKQGDVETMKPVKECFTDNPSADTSVPTTEANTFGPTSEVTISTPVDEVKTSISTNKVTTTTATAPATNCPEHIVNQATASIPATGEPIAANSLKATPSPAAPTAASPATRATPSILKGPEPRKPTTYMGPLSRYDKQFCSRRGITTSTRLLNTSTRPLRFFNGPPISQAPTPRPRGEKTISDIGRNMDVSSPALVGGLEASCYARGRVNSTRMMH